MFAPMKVYNFGGKENDYNERQHDEPPSGTSGTSPPRSRPSRTPRSSWRRDAGPVE
jgi:hypothetical protein